jgi:molybdate transport system ATP-binding protein
MLDLDVKLHRKDFSLHAKFAAASGSVISLFGPSGCGKTTTANLIAGLIKPNEGRIAVGDRVMFDSSQTINVPAEQRGIGYVFQNARLFPHLRVMNNLQYGLRRTQNSPFIDADFVVKLLDLQSLLHRYPGQLSGGEQQRVAIGRALLSQPKLLLLDEPLSSLDIARRNEVLPYLERLRDSLKITMLFVSHQYDEVLRLATHVVLIKEGKCISQGSLREVSLQRELRILLNEESVGAVIDTQVESINSATGLAQLKVGYGMINVDAEGLQNGQQIRIQLLARDLVLSLDPASRVSIRNQLEGTITQIIHESENAKLIQIDVGNVDLLARVTRSSLQDLDLRIGTRLFVLVKAITLRGHVFSRTSQLDPGVFA